FNQSIMRLNSAAARQGRHGEGHTSIRDGHSLYLGPSEQRQIARRQFDALLDSTTGQIALTASLVQDSAPDRLWNPSELFTHRFHATLHRPLTRDALTSLRDATAAWLHEAKSPNDTQALVAIDVGQTRSAYDARRDTSRPSAEYDFALRDSALPPPVLSVSEFERLISAPALVWMKRYLGVEAADDDTNPWSAATGQWVHDWLASVDGRDARERFVTVPDRAEIDRRIASAAEEKCAQIQRLCAKSGKPVPDWWNSGWQNAFCLARHLGAKLGTIEEWPWMAAEWNVDGELPVRVSEDASLLFRGRIDLLLARSEARPASAQAAELWILDYKTGASKKSLGTVLDDVDKRRPRLRKRLLDGSALQLALYAFAVRERGATTVLLSLLSPSVRPVSPQLSLDDIARESDIFEELARMQQTGIFGMHGPLRSAWGFSRDYPLATLAIEPDVLEQRWERTHPALVRDEEEIYW
ncbi:MAG TPA: PD-(D/E)XK nuclease family protein, partial [Chthoniobacterales bacterium]